MRMANSSSAALRDGIRTQNLGRGKRFGGPPAVADALRISERRASGAPWRGYWPRAWAKWRNGEKNRSNVAKKYDQLELIGSN